MNNKISKWINPLLVLIALSLVTQVIESTLSGSIATNSIILVNTILLFLFGMFLSYRKRRSTTWVRKVIISIALMLILLFQLNLLPNESVSWITQWIILNRPITYALIIYFGWAFFE